MMRLFLADITGTGKRVLVNLPLEQQYVDIDTGELVVTRMMNDPIRPDCDMGNSAWTAIFPKVGRGRRPKMIICAEDLNSAPTGTTDLGNPKNPAHLNKILTNAELNTIANYYDLTDEERTIVMNKRPITLKQAIKWLAKDIDDWQPFKEAIFTRSD